MRTRAKKKYVAGDRARRENVLRHILSYCYFFVSGREKINSVPTPSVLITLIFSLCA